MRGTPRRSAGVRLYVGLPLAILTTVVDVCVTIPLASLVKGDQAWEVRLLTERLFRWMSR